MKTFDINDCAVFDGYLLIDPLNIDPERFDVTLPMLRCTPPPLANADALTPRLMDLAALSPVQQNSARDLIADESRDIAPPVVCAWLSSALPADALARHIGRFLTGPGADGHQVLWRYFDPRVFSLAMQLMSDAQREMLIGPVSVWRLPWCGRWWSVDGPGRVIAPLDSGLTVWPTPAQWQGLNESALIERVLREPQDSRPRFPDSLCLQHQREIGLSLSTARCELHLTDSDDLTQYALACARYGDRFRRHARLAAAWPELARGEISWSALRDRLNDDEYQVLETQTTGSAS